MATPAHLEEGYEMDTIQTEARSHHQSSSASAQPTSTSRHSDAHQETPSEESLGHSNLRRASNIKDAAPKGWPSIAALQFYYTNFSLHRRFSCLTQRILMDQETKLAYLETKLEELDKEDERINAPRLRSLPFDPDRLLAACLRAGHQSGGNPSSIPLSSEGQHTREEERAMWQDKDLLLEAMVPRLKSYIELLQLDKEMQRLPTISRREHKAFYDEISKNHALDGPARQFLYSKDDFVTTVTDRAHQYFEAIVYGEGPIMSRIKQLIGRERRNHNQDPNHAAVVEIDKRFLVIPIKVVVTFSSSVLLLSPVAILFLVDLTRGQSFGVVVSFMFAFVTVMSALQTQWGTMLVSLSAYTAVLVTFLSNIEQGKA